MLSNMQRLKIERLLDLYTAKATKANKAKDASVFMEAIWEAEQIEKEVLDLARNIAPEFIGSLEQLGIGVEEWLLRYYMHILFMSIQVKCNDPSLASIESVLRPRNLIVERFVLLSEVG